MTFFKNAGYEFNHYALFRWIFQPDFRVLREKLSRFKKKFSKIGPETGILSTLSTLRTRFSNKASTVDFRAKNWRISTNFFFKWLKISRGIRKSGWQVHPSNFMNGKNLPHRFFDVLFQRSERFDLFPPIRLEKIYRKTIINDHQWLQKINLGRSAM